MIFDLKITNDSVKNKQFVQKYQELVDNQQFLTIYTKLNIAFATGFLNHYNNMSTQQCWQTALHLLWYLHDMIDYEITFDNLKRYRLVIYFNADWAADTKNWKSMTEFLIKIAEALIHWKSIKQTDILLSTTETEYIVISETAKNIMITHKILHELNIILKNFAFLLLINNTSMIVINENEKVIRNCYKYDVVTASS